MHCTERPTHLSWPFYFTGIANKPSNNYLFASCKCALRVQFMYVCVAKKHGFFLLLFTIHNNKKFPIIARGACVCVNVALLCPYDDMSVNKHL